MIKESDIESLAKLSRLELKEEEKQGLIKDMDSILSYIGKLKEAKTSPDLTNELGENKNEMRPDVVRHTPNSFTDDLLSLAPDRDGRYVKVKKIL